MINGEKNQRGAKQPWTVSERKTEQGPANIGPAYPFQIRFKSHFILTLNAACLH